MKDLSGIDFTALALSAAILGPVFGPFALLLFAAVIGALLALSKEGNMTRMEGALFIAVSAGISIVLSGICVWALQKYTNIPGNITLMPVAFAIAAGRSFLLGLIERLVGAIGTFFEAALGGKGRGQ